MAVEETDIVNSGRLTASVIIIGYGPTGQVLALLLARRGHSVIVVERQPQLYPLPRAVHFDQEAARIFQAAEAIDDVNLISEPVAGYEWRNGQGDVLLAFDLSEKSTTGWRASTMFSQPELERVLDRKVKAQPSVRVLQGCEACALTQDDQGVTVTAARGELRDGIWRETGERIDIGAAFVVGADGANSFVRHALGIPVHDLGFAFDWLVVDVVPKIDRDWQPKNGQVCDPRRPTTVVQGGPGRRRWEFMLLPGEHAQQMNRPEVAWDLLAPWDVTPENATLERHAVYTFRAQWVETWRKGRAFLAGDAAHLMPPFAGQGMCAGLRDAAALYWRLDLALTGMGSELLFDSYGPERSGHVRAMIELSVELGKVICITDPEGAAQRDQEMLSARTRPDYQPPRPLLPPLGPGLHIPDTPGGGHLSPQGNVEFAGRVGLFDDVFGPHFALIARRDDDLRSITPENFAFLQSVDATLVALDQEGFRDVEGVYLNWLNSLNTVSVLLRPDFYVYGSARTSDELNAMVQRLSAELRSDSPRAAPAPARADLTG